MAVSRVAVDLTWLGSIKKLSSLTRHSTILLLPTVANVKVCLHAVPQRQIEGNAYLPGCTPCSCLFLAPVLQIILVILYPLSVSDGQHWRHIMPDCCQKHTRGITITVDSCNTQRTRFLLKCLQTSMFAVSLPISFLLYTERHALIGSARASRTYSS